MSTFAVLVAAAERPDWLSRNSTLVVGVVGIVFSGLVGPSVTAWWTARREREKDRRAIAAARQEDLRDVLDGVATTLGGAIQQPARQRRPRAHRPLKLLLGYRQQACADGHTARRLPSGLG